MIHLYIYCCSLAKSCLDSLWPHGLQHTRPLCPLLSPRVCSNSCPLSQWCYLTTLSSAFDFNLSQHQSLFQWVRSSQSGDQSIGASASALVLPINIQGWFPLGLTDLISWQPKETLKNLLQYDSKESVLQSWAFSMVQLSHLYMTPGKTIAFTIWIFVGKVVFLLFNTLCLS